MVGGEPGIGKTRMAEEAGIYARLGGAQVLTGRCYEAESAVPYMPFVEAIRTYVATREPEALLAELGEAASDVAKLVSDIRTRVPDLPSTARTDGEEERHRLFEAVSSFLVNARAPAPSSCCSMTSIGPTPRRSGSSSTCPGASPTAASWWWGPTATSSSAAAIPCPRPWRISGGTAPTSASCSRAVHRGGAGVPRRDDGAGPRGGRTAPRPGLLPRTEGNPYFLEEVVRHLLDTGGAFWESGRWTMDLASVESLAIPEGIRELIGQRLSRLSDRCNDMLVRAAVLGPQFDFAVLERLTGLDGEVLLEAVEEAQRAQLLEETSSQAGRTVYRFGHAVVRQTLYDGLSLTRRQRLHVRAAEALESVHTQNLTAHFPALARHYQEAGSAAADPAKAVEYSVRAGEAAQAVFAHEDAIRHWEAALDMLDESGGEAVTKAVLLGRLGDLKFVTGLDYEGGIHCLERALALYEEMGQPERVAQMHSRLGRDLSTFPDTMDIPRALSHYRAAEAILIDAPESSALGYVFFGQSDTALWAVRTEAGLAAAKRAMEIADRIGNARLRRHTANQHAFHVASAGRLREAFAELEAAWREADATNDVISAFGSTWIAAALCFKLADPVGAKTWCRHELEKPRLAQAPIPRRLLLDELARAHVLAGDLAGARQVHAEAPITRYAAPYLALSEGRWEDAADSWRQQREDNHRRGNRRDEWMVTWWLAWAHRCAGDTTAAEALLEEVLAIGLDGGQLQAEIWARRELALLLADAGRLEDAEAHLDRCREVLAGGEDWRGLAGRVAAAEAVVLVARHRVEEAEAHFTAALEIFRRYTLPWGEAETLRRWGIVRLHAGDRRGAVEKLAAAAEVYRRCGAGANWIEPVLAAKLAAQGVDPTETLASVDLVAASVGLERPDLAPHAAPDGTVTLLFSDIEGSTAANERLGDRRWLEVLQAHNRIIREQVGAHGGFEVKSQGDGFMVAFASARRALQCAADIQRSLRDHAEAHPEEATKVRIGLHTGEAIRHGDDFFGTHVALAARIAGAAKGGEILVSSLLKELTDAAGDIAFDGGREVQLKGLSGKRRIYALLWDAQPGAELGAPTSAAGRKGALATVLVARAPGEAEPGGDAPALGRVLVEAAAGRGDVQTLEGGSLAVFRSPADAMRAAIHLQKESRRGEGGPAVRVGLDRARLRWIPPTPQARPSLWPGLCAMRPRRTRSCARRRWPGSSPGVRGSASPTRGQVELVGASAPVPVFEDALRGRGRRRLRRGGAPRRTRPRWPG